MQITKIFQRNYALFGALLVLLILTPLWFLGNNWYKARLLSEYKAKATDEVALRANALTAAINRRLILVNGLAAFVQAEVGDINFNDKFTTYAGEIYASTNGIRNITLGPANRTVYIYPIDGNERLYGYNPLFDDNATIRDDAVRAVVSQDIVLSGPIELIPGGLGLIARKAIYIEDNYWGLVNIDLDMPPILYRADLIEPTEDLDFAIRKDSGEVIYGSEAIFTQDPVLQRIELPVGYWELGGAPLRGWSAHIIRDQLFFRVATTTISLLLVLLTYLSINRQERLEESERRREVAEKLSRVLAILNTNPALETVLSYIVTQSRGIFQADACLILQVDPTAQTLAVLAADGIAADQQKFGPLAAITEISNDKASVIVGDLDTLPANPDGREPEIRLLTHLTEALREYRALIAIPIIIKHKTFGYLVYLYTTPRNFPDEVISLAEAFAEQTILAIENAQLYEEVQQLASLQERHKLARDLHDSVSQALYGIGLGTRTAQELISNEQEKSASYAKISETLDYILTLTEAGLGEMRALIFGLRLDSLETEGLRPTVQKLMNMLRDRHKLQVSVSIPEEPDLPAEDKQAVLRIIQEAMQNTLKHAQATEFEIQFVENQGVEYQLILRDNGIGFDPTKDYPGHIGLKSMPERVEKMGGSFSIESQPNAGTTILVTIPRRTSN